MKVKRFRYRGIHSAAAHVEKDCSTIGKFEHDKGQLLVGHIQLFLGRSHPFDS